jgi:hypothetical protein
MTRSIVAVSLAAGLCAALVGQANAGGHGGGGGFHGGFHGGFGSRGGFGFGSRGFGNRCCYGGYGWWGPGVAFGLGLGAIAAAPYYYPPPYYFPPYYPPPPIVYAPPQAYSQGPGGAGQSCYAGAYVCPMDRPVATGSGCYCLGNNGQRVGGRAS